MQPTDRVNINWSPSPVQNKDATSNKYEATWSNGEKTHTITVGFPNGLSHEYVKIIEEQFKVNDMDLLAKYKFSYDPLKNDGESQTFSAISSAAEITFKRTELRGWITRMLSPKSDLMIEAVVVSKNRSLTSETSPTAGRSSFVSRASPESSISPSPEFNKALFDRLPDEMIVSMLMKLSVKEIVRMREVDTRFRDIGGDALAEKICNENVSLAEFGLKGNAKILAFLESLHPENRLRIRQLNLSGTKINNRFLAGLFRLTPNLQGLNLEGCDQITDDGLQHLAPLTELQSLNLEGCSISNDGLKHLTPLTELRSLNVARCSQISNDGLQHLAPFKKLENLNLEKCRQITDEGLQHLVPLKKLENLSLEECYQITNDGLPHLTSFKKLKNLSLAWCSKITNDGLQHLATLTQLRGLNLEMCVLITGAGLQHLARLTELRSLNLSGCRLITNDGLNHLALFKELQNLSLDRCYQITNEGLQHLAPFTELRVLSFVECSQITNDGLQHLVPLKKLRNLSLVWCLQITDDGLQHLATLTQLRSLNLAQCDKITDAGRNALKRHIPDLDLRF